VVTYSDQETEEGRFLWELRQQWKQAPLIGPIELTCEFYMPIPASLSEKKKLSLNKTMHTKKPDLDNLVKWIKDIFNKTVWQDDSQVYFLQATKFYSDRPKTEITVERREI
jgi:Holliday junction resolvase RusA-like endonuclease